MYFRKDVRVRKCSLFRSKIEVKVLNIGVRFLTEFAKEVVFFYYSKRRGSSDHVHFWLVFFLVFQPWYPNFIWSIVECERLLKSRVDITSSSIHKTISRLSYNLPIKLMLQGLTSWIFTFDSFFSSFSIVLAFSIIFAFLIAP